MVLNYLAMWIKHQKVHVFYQVCRLLWIHIPRIITTIWLSFLTPMVCWPSTLKPCGLHKKQICLSTKNVWTYTKHKPLLGLYLRNSIIMFFFIQQYRSIYYGLIIQLVRLCANIALTINNDAYVCTWNSNY
jgi:hypothetical protein